MISSSLGAMRWCTTLPHKVAVFGGASCHFAFGRLGRIVVTSDLLILERLGDRALTDARGSGPAQKWHKVAVFSAWFNKALIRVTLGISARTLIGPALERVHASLG